MSDRKGGRGGNPRRRGTRLALAGILLAGMLLRALFLVQLRGSPMWAIQPLDMRFYRELAGGLASGGALPSGPLTFNPLYPFFLAGVFRVFGEGDAAVRIIQSIIGLATVLLVYVAAGLLADDGGERPVRGERAGLVAAGLAVLYPHFLLYESAFIGTTLVTFLFTASFALALTIERRYLRAAGRRAGLREAWLPLFVLGLTIGAGALGRPNLFFLLVPALGVWLAARAPSRRGGALLLLPFAAGVLLLLAPPILHNARRAGGFVPVTAHGGVNFYIGNGPSAKPMYSPPDGMRMDMRGLIEDSRKLAEQESGRKLSDAEVSDFWLGKTLEHIRSHPGRWLGLLARKLYLYWNGVEIADVLVIDFFRDHCPVIRILFLPFTVISPLSLVGLALLLRRRRSGSAVSIFVAAGAASVILFYVNSRYRQPVMPVLITLSALYLVWLAEEIRSGRWRWPVVSVLAFGILLGAVSSRRPVRINKSAGYVFLGNYYMQQGEEVKGEEMFSKAFHSDPNSIEAQISYARALKRRGKPDESAVYYALAWRNNPDFPTLANTYGALLEELGQRDRARQLYLHAYSLDRTADRVIACKLLSRLAYAEGDIDGAIEWVRRGLEIAPEDGSLADLLRRLQGG